VCDSPVVADVLADIPPRLWVVRRGRVTVETRHETTIHRTAPVPGA
jgi:cytosine/creatinine deaminase